MNMLNLGSVLNYTLAVSHIIGINFCNKISVNGVTVFQSEFIIM